MNNIDDETMIESIEQTLDLNHYDFRNRGKEGYNYKYYIWDMDDQKKADEFVATLREKAKKHPQITKVILGKPCVHSDTSYRYRMYRIPGEPKPDVRSLRICCKAKLRPKKPMKNFLGEAWWVET